MGVVIIYNTFPTDKIINLIDKRKDIIEDVLKLLGINENLIKSGGEMEKEYLVIKEIFYRKCYESFQKNKLDINSLDDIHEEIDNRLGYRVIELLFSKPRSIYNPEVIYDYNQRFLFLTIAECIYRASEFPIKGHGFIIENSSEDEERIIRYSQLEGKEIDKSIFDLARDKFGSHIREDMSDLIYVLDCFDIAKERKEDIIYTHG
jgi:hypothetical protein